MIEGSPGSILSPENAADSVARTRRATFAGAPVDDDKQSAQKETQTKIWVGWGKFTSKRIRLGIPAEFGGDDHKREDGRQERQFSFVP